MTTPAVGSSGTTGEAARLRQGHHCSPAPGPACSPKPNLRNQILVTGSFLGAYDGRWKFLVKMNMTLALPCISLGTRSLHHENNCAQEAVRSALLRSCGVEDLFLLSALAPAQASFLWA